MMKKAAKIAGYLIIGLIIFLPISAWLVSFLGVSWISLGRDLLVFLVFLAFLFAPKKFRFDVVFWVIILFIVWGLLSYFWREEGLNQWLRGVRYYLEPFVLVLIIRSIEFERAIIKKIAGIFLYTVLTIALIGLIEFLVPSLFRYSISDIASRGALTEIHQIAGQGRRMQSLLAGPNALGLYLMIAIAGFWCWAGKMKKWQLAILILIFSLALISTASRSSIIGLAIALIVGIYLKREYISQGAKLVLVRTLVVAVVLLIAAVLLTPDQILSHGTSNNIRIEQYHRLYNQRSEIGFLGRGIGSSGLASQYRLDGGPNYYSENSYLDMYEGLGIIGFLLYLGLWIALVIKSFQFKNEFSSGVFLVLLSLMIAGIMTTHFTGQAALWSGLILFGLISLENRPLWLEEPLSAKMKNEK